MMIQVENPLAILTQDTARAFLSSSTPEMKYDLFLKGAGLKQLKEDYDHINKMIDVTKVMLEKKKQALPDLIARVKELEQKWNDLEQARTLDVECDRLRDQLIWSNIQTMESELEEMQKSCHLLKKKLESYDAAMHDTRAKIQQFESDSQGTIRDEQRLGEEMQPLFARIQEIKSEIIQTQRNIRELENEEREMRRVMQHHKQTSCEFTNRIEVETRRIENDTGEARERKRTELAHLQDEMKRVEAQRSDFVVTRERLEGEIRTLERAKEGATTMTEQIKIQLRSIERDLQSLQQQKTDRLKAYGQSMPDVIREVRQLEQHGRWRGRMPIGPFGTHIKVKDKKWTKVVETVLGHSLSALGVETHEDMKLLQQILDKHRLRNTIFKYSSNLFDYSHGEPDEQYKTMLRVLDIDNPIVLRQMIINHKIEKVVLVESRSEGDYITGRGFPNNVAAVYTIDCMSMGARGGGYATTALRVYQGHPRLAVNIEDAIREYDRTKHGLRQTFDEAQKELESVSSNLNHLFQDRVSCRKQQESLSRNINHLEARIQDVNESLREEDPPNVSSLVEAKRTEDEKYELIAAQLRHLEDRKKPVLEALEQYQNILAGAEGNANSHKEKVKAFQALRDHIAMERYKAEAAFNHHLEKRQRHEQTYNAELTSYELRKAATERAILEAEVHCARVAVRRRPEAIERDIRNLEARIQEKEKDHGSLEEIYQEFVSRKEALETVKAQVENNTKFLELMGNSMASRWNTWSEFRRSISATAKINFATKMRIRGYSGKLILDHDSERLSLLVTVEDKNIAGQWQTGSSSAEKDPKSLSGGEKSFSTICLLLSLWESMNNPFRALDEFDVFMDAVNRRMSMKLLIDNAREPESRCQYILITPQDMSHIRGIAGGSDVRIHRMENPERGQTQLNFNSQSQSQLN